MSDSVFIAFNYYQINSSDTVVTSSNENNPVTPSSDPLAAIKLRNLGTTRLPSFAAFGLDGSLTPLATSPALNSGVDLHAAGAWINIDTN